MGYGPSFGSCRDDHRVAHADTRAADARKSKAYGESNRGFIADPSRKARQAGGAFCVPRRPLQSVHRLLCRRGRLPVWLYDVSPSRFPLSVADDSTEAPVGKFLAGSVRRLLEHSHALSCPLDLRPFPSLSAGPSRPSKKRTIDDAAEEGRARVPCDVLLYLNRTC